MFWIACPSSYDCRAILRRPVRGVIWSGLDQAQSFPPPTSYPLRLRILSIYCPFPFAPCRLIRLVSSHPSRPPACFAPIRPANRPMLSPAYYWGRPPCGFPSLPLIAITPHPACRVSGADFLNASNSMPLKMGPWSGSFLAACLPSCVARAARRLISSSHRDVPRSLLCLPLHPISSRVWSVDGADTPSLPAHRLADRVEGRGDIALLTVMRGVSALAWRAVLFLSKTFFGNLLKIYLENLLKTFPSNLLETVKHALFLCPPRLSAVALSYVAVCRLAVLPRLRF